MSELSYTILNTFDTFDTFDIYILIIFTDKIMFKYSNINIYNEINKIWSLNKPIDMIDEYINSSGQLFFDNQFNQPLNFLNNKVKWIFFGELIEITNCLDELPNSIVGIVFDFESRYLSNLDHLPNSLEYLIFKEYCEFNSSVNNLPNGLKYLSLCSEDFDQPIDCLPQSLEYLALGINFNHPIKSLPKSLKELTIINYNYNHPIKSLPESLKKLVLESKKFSPLEIFHMENLISLKITIPTDFSDVFDWKKLNLKMLDISCENIKIINNCVFPDTLEKLTIKNIATNKNKNIITINNLPQFLKILKITSKNKFVINLPDSIITMVFFSSHDIDQQIIISNKKYFISTNEINDEYTKHEINRIDKEHIMDFYDENII